MQKITNFLSQVTEFFTSRFSKQDTNTPGYYFEAFKRRYSHKYKFQSEKPLGSGAQASVYEARDVARNLKVAIKIYHDGIAPLGAARDWVISSRVNHHQIAHTYTIEDFKVNEKLCRAVVTRFVPGKSLHHIFYDCLNTYDPATLAYISEDFAYSLVPSILEILSFCHRESYGHGDLTPGNVLAIWTNGDVTFDTMAALIDFDNAVVKSNLIGNTNKDKMQSDYRALKRIIIDAVQEWEHVQIVRTLWESYEDVPNLNIAYKKFITFLKLSKHNPLTKEFILDYLKTLVLIDTNREDLRPIIAAIKSVCAFHGKHEQYNAAILQFDEHYQDYVDLEIMDTNMTILKKTAEKLEVYDQIFNT